FFRATVFEVIDRNFIEKLQWKQLNLDDLYSLDTRSIWKNGDAFYSLRNDWTDQIQHYSREYHLKASRVTYAGPISINEQIYTNLGVEIFNPNRNDMLQCYQYIHDFIQNELELNVDFAVIGHYQLFDLLLPKEEQTEELFQAISERNISKISKLLTQNHTLVQLLKTPTHQQLDFLTTIADTEHPTYKSLLYWKAALEESGINHIHLDITTMPPKSYYVGSFIQLYQNNNRNPIASGGHYNGTLEGFGFGIQLN
ncbi:MAG: ATP phosphoribosyltransferase regulatory subunit, partial [Mammaliicoccus vitulinus]